jgi:hypothetical protein
MKRVAMIGLGLAALASCGPDRPRTPAPPPPVGDIETSTLDRPAGPDAFGSIRADPALLGAWADYCTRLVDVALPPPDLQNAEQRQIDQDLATCEAAFGS